MFLSALALSLFNLLFEPQQLVFQGSFFKEYCHRAVWCDKTAHILIPSRIFFVALKGPLLLEVVSVDSFSKDEFFKYLPKDELWSRF